MGVLTPGTVCYCRYMNTQTNTPTATFTVELSTGCDECHQNCNDDGYGYSDCCGAPLL